MGRGTVVRVLGLAAAGVLGVGVAFAAAGPILKSSRQAALGKIVVNGKGLTLYHASRERPGKLACVGNCLYYWFPVIVKSTTKIALGPGLSKAKIGTIKRPNGTLQVTYNKLPLYRYYLDRKPGQTKGQRISDAAGTWYVVSTSGKVVTKSAGTGTGTTTTDETTTGFGY
jgi:predicted lipoprotein with Yx(FWY)xxD motif